jgi:hypothetical protein
MRFETLDCPTCGEEARGTCETLIGTAELVHHEDGTSDYAGDTIIHWDGQQTVEDGHGRVMLDCANGHEWPSREVS